MSKASKRPGAKPAAGRRNRRGGPKGTPADLPAEELRIVYVDLDEVRPRESNAKDHDVGAIVQSMRRFRRH